MFVISYCLFQLCLLPPPLQDLAGSLERARARVKPPTKGGKSEGSPDGGNQDEDDATAQELGLTAEVRTWAPSSPCALPFMVYTCMLE